MWRVQAYASSTSPVRCIIEVAAESAEAAQEELERQGWTVVRVFGRAKSN